ncbi:MAG TPA: glycosyltransferase family 9 protein [Candidatus Binatia bacterium]|nr:glycosyltransferase family 9 protein [Candidatus Binatia bacterium]
MRKLILTCGLSPGDIVMLTAAVRDLHRCYPHRFLTDVRTPCPDLWEHNPFITKLSDDEPGVERLDCSYPLIDRSNDTPYHCLHGFVEFLNERLKLSMRPTAFKGDIHLSAQEKAWYSQVHEWTGQNIPFWIVAAGGKYDVTIKWWQTQRYQEVVDHFRGKIQFVQVGQQGHHHPRLESVIDLRGKTSLRELVRLVYHSQGVLCSVTALMHLAAAVETKHGRGANRPCVVVAGGREPAHWEAYPEHQFIHTIGAIPCCQNGGCWRDRVVALGDGERRDRRENRCVDVRHGLPRCLELITPAEVIRRIELYFQGGAVRNLTASQRAAARRGVAATARNGFDKQPLNIHEAGLACSEFIKTIPQYPALYDGRGIVMCGGGVRYFTCAWVCINILRRVGCKLPIEFWYLGPREVSKHMAGLLKPLGVECRDAMKVRKRFPARILHGWELKPYAILHSRFREVLLLDADNVPVVDPEFLFETPQFMKTGAVFWPDFKRPYGQKAKAIWRSCGMRLPKEGEFETGQILVDKARAWRALCLTLWFNENSDFYYRYVHGDKETFHLAFRKLRQNYSLVPKPIQPLKATMCQHDFLGGRIFQHRNLDKWDLLLQNQRIRGFWFEPECREYIRQLQRVWDGTVRLPFPAKRGAPFLSTGNGQLPRILPVMISCAEREELRKQTLQNLAETDWGAEPVYVELDHHQGDDHELRQTRCAFRALQAGLEGDPDYILFLEDDLDFNRHLRYNLQSWKPLNTRQITLAGLYNPQLRELACDVRNQARLIDPKSIFGSQAFLLSRETAKHVIRHWKQVPGKQDIKISRLAGRLGGPVLYHAPSLVEHTGRDSVWGGRFHRAIDFDRSWRRPVTKG